MSRYSPELLQKIRDANNIVDIVGEHVTLRKTGTNHVGLCPFHSERTPSFSVSEQKQLYHCYGCKKGGDLFGFTMEIHGISFPEAIEELADRARIPLPKDGFTAGSGDPEVERRRQEARAKTSTAYRLNYFVAMFYHGNLKNMPEAMSYLRSRGVTDELLKNFYLGAASGGWDMLAQHLAAKKAPIPLATELGLVRPSQKGSGSFDLFRNRVIFPILDMRGKIAGFGGRTLPGENGAGDGPKYLNSSESFIFQKGKLAYGLFQAQKHIREKDEVILVEGYFDVLGMHAAGFQNVVASCGTALTADHLAVFRRLASRIVLLFDGDQAGIAATERSMELGLEHGLVLLGAVMPPDLDPDEILFDQKTGQPLPAGKARMEEILAQAKPLLDTRIEEAIQSGAASPEARTQAVKRIAGWLAKFRDPVGREVRLEHVQKKMGISRELLDRAMGVAPRPRAPSPAPVAARPAPVPKKPLPPRPKGKFNPGERILLSGLVRGGEFERVLAASLSAAGDKMPPETGLADLFEYIPAQEWVRGTVLGGGFRVDPVLLTQSLATGELDPLLASTLTAAGVGSDETPFQLKDFQIALDRAISRLWARFSQRIKAALADAEAKKDTELQALLMKEYLDVQRKMKEFNSFYDEA